MSHFQAVSSRAMLSKSEPGLHLQPLLFLLLEPLLWGNLGGETAWSRDPSGRADSTWSAQGPACSTLQSSERQAFTWRHLAEFAQVSYQEFCKSYLKQSQDTEKD